MQSGPSHKESTQKKRSTTANFRRAGEVAWHVGETKYALYATPQLEELVEDLTSVKAIWKRSQLLVTHHSQTDGQFTLTCTT